jgi:lipid A biosynthesis lauroyl/palmitoleoyl acyltransferase
MNKICGINFSLSLLHPKYFITWLGLGLFFVISLLPTPLRHGFGNKLGEIIYKRNGKRRNTVKTNLTIAFPDIDKKQRDDLALRHLQWYGCALIDYSVLFFASKKRLSKMFEIRGQEHIDKALRDNRSVMILLAHSVMLEFAPAALGAQYDVFGSYKNSKNAVLDWVIAKSRCRHVKYVISRDEGLRRLVKSLAPGKIMIFLPDEDLGEENAVFAPFFGKQKSTLTTTARIAKMAKAIALPAFAYFDAVKSKYIIQIGLPLDNYPSADAIVDATRLNQGLEKLIEQNPAQYMWLMKWYKTRPPGEKAIY